MFRLIFAGISLYVWIDTNYKEIPQMGDTESLDFWMSLLDVTFGCILRTLLLNVTFAHKFWTVPLNVTIEHYFWT